MDFLHRRVGLQLQMESEQAKNTEARLSLDKFREIVRQRLEDEGESGADLETLLSQVIEAATERLVFLVGMEEGKVGFEIRSLQEFMAAEYLVDEKDELCRERLRSIAPVAHWRNVFLFACGKCFAKKQYLRPEIMTLCSEMNEDDETGISKTLLAGSALALELLEDGPARNQKKYSDALLRIALRLLETEDSSNAHRLNEMYEPRFAGVYQEELRKHLAGKAEGSYGSWSLLLLLVRRNDESWPLEMAKEHWFRERATQLDFVSFLLSDFSVEHFWSEFVSEKVSNCLAENFQPKASKMLKKNRSTISFRRWENSGTTRPRSGWRPPCKCFPSRRGKMPMVSIACYHGRLCPAWPTVPARMPGRLSSNNYHKVNWETRKTGWLWKRDGRLRG